jgi:predicted methyltransferase
LPYSTPCTIDKLKIFFVSFMKKSIFSLTIAPTLFFTAFNVQPYDTQTKKQPVQQSPQSLSMILEQRPIEIKARYHARHPAQTIDFFGIKPGMTVVEAFPGNSGWYSKILLPYLGVQGKLIGSDYANDMWSKFDWMTKEMLVKNKTWVKDWTSRAQGWRNQHSASVSAFQLGSMPTEINGSADVVVFIRALHNLAYFENNGGYLTAALKDAHQALKPGGIVGIVQHMAPETASVQWANGSNGYLKKSFVIAKMKAAGFEYIDSSDININPKDKPTTDDIVWRLPPSFANSKDKPELKKEYVAVGESTRMTLTFRKPK